MSKEAWGRWGEADECGSLNLIGRKEVLHAATLVRTGEVLSLSQPIFSSMPIPAHRPGVIHLMNRDGGDYAAGARRPGGFQFADDTIVMPVQVGTHIDALCHAWYEDQLYNGFAGNSIRSTTGAEYCGVEKLSPIVTRGVLLDLVRENGGPLAADQRVTRTDLEAAASAAGVVIGKGDAVLLRTGWIEQINDGAPADFNREPGIDVDAALWLAEAEVGLIGADNYAVEVLPFADNTVFPVHQRLIRDYGIPLIEGLVLGALAKAGASTCLFTAAPLLIVGATGSPLNPVAVL